MIASLLAVALLLGAPEPAAPATPPALAQPAWSGEPGWMVLGDSVRLAGDGARGAREAARKTGERIAKGIAVAPVRSELFAGLRKGFIVLVYGGAAADRARADTLAAELNAKGVKVYVKQSGALVRPRARLVRLWGRLDDTIRFPAALTIDDSPASTDKDGWYQFWIAVDGGKKQGSIELCAGAIDYRDRKAACTDPTGGWFDICHNESYDAKTKDLHVEWSPTPDCSGE